MMPCRPAGGTAIDEKHVVVFLLIFVDQPS